MNIIRNNFLFFCFFLLLFLPKYILAQGETDLYFPKKEIELKLLIDSILSCEALEEKQLLNDQFCVLLKEVLEHENSFIYPFSELNNIAKTTSSDENVRVFSWAFPKNNGTYAYFAAVQFYLKNDKKFVLTFLEDKSEEIQNPENAALNARKWFGAVYYQVLYNKDGNDKYYTLLGWNGSDKFSEKRVIEAMTFNNNGQPVFNSAIFVKDRRKVKRIILEHSEQSQMNLRYNENLNMIVFDHLMPTQPTFEGNYKFYVPDASFDGLLFEDGAWILKPDVDVRNDY